LNRLVSGVAGIYPRLRVIDVNGAAIQNAGSTLVEELAFTLAMASEYMAELTARGIDPHHIQDAMQLSLSSGPNFFMEIAKLRAARVLWSSIAVAYGADPFNAVITIHSTSSSWNLTLYDPYMNLLRGTSGAISAILGGADYLTVLPYDYPSGISSSFSDRIARNVQIIMREESYLDRVSDPASGSYYIENLTDSIGEKAWKLFREVESMGGFRKAFESGWIQQQVHQSRQRKLERYSSGEFKLVGTNSYPNFNEAIEEYFIKSEKEAEQDSQVQPLVPFRPSSMFEKVRYATESSRKRPKVFLLKYGNSSRSAARANFSGNFFACAGYEILERPQFNSIEDGVNVARYAKAEVVVFCSSDDEYEMIAPEVCSELKDLSLLVVAGFPANSMEKLKEAGISHFIHQKCNLLETLEEFNSILL
jgi:methylmalonyl-CoA mutase